LRILRYLRGRLHSHEEALSDAVYWAARKIRQHLPAAVLGRSRRGSIVILFKYGQWDVESAVRDFGPHSVLESEVERLEWQMWHLDELSRREGKVRYVMGIIDLDCAGTHQLRGHTRRVMLEAGRLFGNAYVDSVEVILCVNSPWIFKAVWAVASPLMTERQKAKFHLLGSSKCENVRKVLRATVPPEILPREYGGTAEPDLWGIQARKETKALLVVPEAKPRKHRRQPACPGSEASWSNSGLWACCLGRHSEAPVPMEEDTLVASQTFAGAEPPTLEAEFTLDKKVMNGKSSPASWQSSLAFWGIVSLLILVVVNFLRGG